MATKPTARLTWMIVLAAVAVSLAACVAPSPAPTKPGVPTAVAVGACAGGLQAVSWTAPVHNGGAAIDHYDLYEGMSAPTSVASTTASVPCTDNTGSYRVQACNSVGCGSTSVPAGYIPSTP